MRAGWVDKTADAIIDRDVELPGKVDMACVICGVRFQCERARYLNGQRTCSRKCGYVYRSEKSLVELTCFNCGKTFKRGQSNWAKGQRTFCDRECRHEFQRKHAMTEEERKEAQREWVRKYRRTDRGREVENAKTRRRYARHREAGTGWYWGRRNAGLCTKCGEPALDGMSRCRACRDKDNALRAERRRL